MYFSQNVLYIVREARLVRVHVLAKRVYGSNSEANRRKTRRLMRGVVEPRIDDLILYARSCGVDAEKLGFSSPVFFQEDSVEVWEDVSNLFSMNLSHFIHEKKIRSVDIARILRPRSSNPSYVDQRRVMRLASGESRPLLEDIQLLSSGFGISPGALMFGRLS